MDRATEPPNKNALLKSEATVVLKDFNAVARYLAHHTEQELLCQPFGRCCWVLSSRRKKKLLPVGEELMRFSLGQ